MKLIVTLDPTRLKFLDESHFIPKSLVQRRGVGPCGKRIIVVRDTMVENEERFTLTICTSIAPEDAPVTAAVTNGKNDSAMFFNFCLNLLHQRYLKPGDMLILDNSRVWVYSPEFNPAELVFAKVKNSIRAMCAPAALWAEVGVILASISNTEMKRYYLKSIMGSIS